MHLGLFSLCPVESLPLPACIHRHHHLTSKIWTDATAYDAGVGVRGHMQVAKHVVYFWGGGRRGGKRGKRGYAFTSYSGISEACHIDLLLSMLHENKA